MDDERTVRLWAIGELAVATGVSVRSLRHYHRIGLLVPSGRTAAGHRRYTDAVLLLRRQAEQVAEQLSATVRLQRTLSDVLTRLDVLDVLDEPTTEDLITLMEEMTEQRRQHFEALTPQQRDTMNEQRRAAWEAMTAERRAELAASRAAVIPPGRPAGT